MKNQIFKATIAWVLITFSANIYSYTPTLESLLRNANNIDVGSNSVVANLTIIEIDNETNLPVIDEAELATRQAIKILINNENEDFPRLTQINYKGGIISQNTMVNFTQKSFRKIKNVVANEENMDAEFFYATMSMLLNNKGSMLLEVLKKHNTKVKSNIELLNKEKLSLLREFKKYLVEVKNDEEAEMENPLKPATEEKKQKVSEVNKKNFLNVDPMVKKVKLDDNFYWIVEKENIYFKFNIDHRIREMKVTTSNGEFEIIFGNYVKYGAQLEFPEFIWLRDITGRKYEIKATKLQMFSDSKELHQKRIKRYRKTSEENKITDPLIRPAFLL